MANETWMPVETAPNYEVSDHGRVRRRDGRVLSWRAGRGGYLYVVLMVDGCRKTLKVHRLVCSAFNGPTPDPGLCCAHRDGSPQNNVPGNLYWATYKQNSADRERHGRTARGPMSGPRNPSRGDDHWTRQRPEAVLRGDQHPKRLRPELVARGEKAANAKLSDAAVREILATPRYHGSGRALAERFGVSMGLISHVRHGRNWTHA